MRKRLHPRQILIAAAAVCCGLAAVPAQAIVSTTVSTSLLGSALDDALDGVAKLIINGSTGCSGTLLAGGAYILTAAHCVTNSTGSLTATSIQVSLDGGAVTGSVTSSSQISVYSTWNGTLGENDDLALLKLDTVITSVAGYALYTGTLSAGQDVLIARLRPDRHRDSRHHQRHLGTLHYGYNEYEASAQQMAASCSTSTAAVSRTTCSAARAWAAARPPSHRVNSGGSSFIVGADGELYLVGVHSYGGTLTSGRTTDVDSTLNSSFGELPVTRWSTAPPTSAGSSPSPPLCPNPRPWRCGLGGLLALGGLRRRR